MFQLGEGIYYLEKPLVFEPEVSGADGAQILYQGHGDVVISGGTRIYPNWEYIGDGIYRAVLEKGLEFDQFFVNGEKKIMARYPDDNETAKYFWGYAADCLSPERTGRYAHLEGGYIHAMHRALWGDMHYRVTGRNEDGELEYTGGWQNNRPSEMHAGRTFIEPMEPVLRSDWCLYRGGTIFLEGTEHVSFVGCKVEGVGGNGFMASGYNRGLLIKDCEISDVGASGILFAGNVGAVRSPLFGYESIHGENGMDLQPGPACSDYPARCRVEGNLIYRSGRVEKQSAGVSLSVCEEIEIRHNTIHDVPRAGINICDGTWGGHVIEKNIVFHTVLETSDHGAFNSWGRDRYWDYRYDVMAEALRENPKLPLLDAGKTTVIRDNIFECANGWDIDLDDGSSNYLITGNLCLRGGIKNREGTGRRVVNNVMLGNTFPPMCGLRAAGMFLRKKTGTEC